MTDQISFTPERAVEDNVLSGAQARFYETGTLTGVTVYSDAAGTTPIAQPLVADSKGVFAQVFYSGTVAVKCVVTDADDSALWTIDPCPLTPTASGTAESTSAEPFTGVTGTNVQAQIEQVFAAIEDTTVNAQTLVQTGGSSNAYTLAAASTITAYAVGQRFLIRINHENDDAATLNIDSLGTRPIQRYEVGGSLIELDAKDLTENSIHEVAYDGTRFVLLDPHSAETFTGAITVDTADADNVVGVYGDTNYRTQKDVGANSFRAGTALTASANAIPSFFVEYSIQGTTADAPFIFNIGAQTRARIASDGQVQSWGPVLDLSSFRHMKSEIREISDSEAKVANLRPFFYEHNEFGPSYGLMIDDLVKDLPECVKFDDDGEPIGYMPTQIIPVMLAELHRLQREVAALKGATPKTVRT